MKSPEIILDLNEEVVMPRPKKAKTAGTQPMVGLISVEVGPLKDSLTETIAVLRQQNDALWHIIDTQKLILDSAMNQM
jgi:hypothetical protein